MIRIKRDQYEKAFLALARAITVGAAYVAVLPIPGLTSSFVAIFTSLLPFDLIVASTRPPLSLRDWAQFQEVLHPRVHSTATTLLKGIAVATVVGLMTLLGLPYLIGAVLTSGVSYVWALRNRYVISGYVAILSGLNLFERLIALDAVETVRIVREVVNVIILSGGGTFMALIAGWGVGFITGSVTRLFLSRPYRSLRSAAYDLPMEMRPFNEVLHVGEKSIVVSAVVEEGAPVAYRSLAESNLRERWRATVLSIKRDDGETVMPDGSAVLLPGDELIVLTERDQSSLVYDQFRRSEPEVEPESA